VQRLEGARRSEQDDWQLGVKWQPVPAPAAKITGGRWLLLGRGEGLADRLRAALAQCGHAVRHVTEVPSSWEARRDLLTSAFDGQPPSAVVHLAGLDAGTSDSEAGPAPIVLRAYESALRTVQMVIDKGYRDVPRLWLVTRGAQALGVTAVTVEQAPLLGLARTIALEHPALRCARIDLDLRASGDEALQLMAELLADDGEEEIAVRGGQRHVSRLVRRTKESVPRERLEPVKGRPFRLEQDAPGGADRLVLRATARRPPGPGEVEIAVEAAGLCALDRLAAEEIPGGPEANDRPVRQLGNECAGRIVATGPGVQGLAVGDSVMALAAGCFASHLTCSASRVVSTPRGLSSAQAAAIPIATLTAYYALAKLAHLAAGERVLIHWAAEPVGLAAIQWARHAGAEIYATAGSAEKRAYLESLGVRFVSDSRADKFVEDILAWTGGEGVDVVLNSLPAETIPRSLELLRAQGRFVEIAQPDTYHNVRLGLQPFLRNLTFLFLDLGMMLRQQPEQVVSLLHEIVGLCASGVFVPPRLEEMSIASAVDALGKLAQAQPIGKLVLTMSEADLRVQVPVSDKAMIRRDGTYLVSGGLGGLGLSVAGWLAAEGAGQLVLMSRTGVTSDAQKQAVESLRARGCQVMVAQRDVADREAVESLLRQLSESPWPLRGVIHAAGVLEDGLLMKQTREQIERVLRPKVQGAWNLHVLTRQLQLDFFVMYSSAAGLLGSPGQGSYAAANTFLDALAHRRRAEGLPAQSIDWGAFSEVGLAAAEKSRGERLALRGMRSITPAEGLKVLAELLGGSEAQVGVVPLNLRQWGAFHQVAAASARLSELRKEEKLEEKSEGDSALLARLRAAAPAARPGLIAEQLRGQVAHVLRIPENKVELDTPLTSLGLDSLMGLELRNRVETLFGIQVPATLLWTYPTLLALSGQLAQSIAGPAEEAVRQVGVESPSGDQKDAISLASEAELFALLDESLARADTKVLR